MAPTLVDSEVIDECFEGRYYDTNLDFCMPCGSLCFMLDSTVTVDQKCCTALQTCKLSWLSYDCNFLLNFEHYITLITRMFTNSNLNTSATRQVLAVAYCVLYNRRIFANMSLAGPGGFPKLASGCAQSIGSTSNVYDNFMQSTFPIDLQQEAFVSRTIPIMASIIFIALVSLALFLVIAFRFNRKCIHYSKVGCSIEFIL